MRVATRLPLLWASMLLLGLPVCQAQTPAPPPAPAPSDTLATIKTRGSVILGVRESSTPFSFLNEEKKHVGYSIDLCLKVVDRIKADLKLPKLDVQIVQVTSQNRIPFMQEGKIDLECGSTTNTKERQQQVAFSYSMFITGVRYLVKTKNPATNLDGLRDSKIVVTKGTTAEKLLRAKGVDKTLRIEIVTADDHAASFKMVEAGTAAAFAMDDILLFGLAAKSANPKDFKVIGKYESVEPYAIMFRKGDPKLEKLVNSTLSKLFSTGEINAIYKRWFETEKFNVPMSTLLKDALRSPNAHPAFP